MVVLLFLLPVAALLFGGVHLWSRLCLTIAMVVCGVLLARRGRFEDHRKALWILMAGLVLAAVPLIPVNGSLRQFLHGDLASPVQNVHELLGRSLRPLALDPAGALLGWSEAAAFVIYGLGLSSWCTRAGRVQSLQRVMIGTGVAVVGVI